jgi:hypothetical protein
MHVDPAAIPAEPFDCARLESTARALQSSAFGKEA